MIHKCLIGAVIALTGVLGGQFVHLKNVQNQVVVMEQKAVIAQKQAAMYALENSGLKEQHEKTVAQLEIYQKRNQALHDEIVTKLNRFEQRTDQLQQELSREINQVWANQPLPRGVSQLLNQRTQRHSSEPKTPAVGLPHAADLPNAHAHPAKK